MFSTPSLLCDYLRRIPALALLLLLTASFILENSVVFEGELLERAESSEKELDPKEKKLLIFSLDINLSNPESNVSISNYIYPHFQLSGIYIDVLTPPPDHT